MKFAYVIRTAERFYVFCDYIETRRRKCSLLEHRKLEMQFEGREGGKEKMRWKGCIDFTV
jgi:hypothetical protein